MCVYVHICVFADVFSTFLLLADAPIKLMPMFTWDPVSNNGLDAKYIFHHEYSCIEIVSLALIMLGLIGQM